MSGMFAPRISGIDINGRAIECSEANAALWDIRFKGNNISDTQSHNWIGDSDLVVFNPPFIFGPSSGGYIDSDGGSMGIEMSVNIFKNLNNHLKTGSQFAAIAQTPIIYGEHLLYTELEMFEDLMITYSIIDEFPPFMEYSEWYASTGVDGFAQVFLCGKKGKGLSLNVTEEAEYCFG